MSSTSSQIISVVLFCILTQCIYAQSARTDHVPNSYWPSFECFSPFELDELFETDYRLEIKEMGQGIDLVLDDRSLSSLTAAIILREIMGFNISLSSSFTYSNTLSLIVNSSYIASSLEVYPSYLNQSEIHRFSIENQVFVDLQLGVQSFRSWYIPNSFIAHILNTTATAQADDIWLDFWKTYTSTAITEELATVDELQSLNMSSHEDSTKEKCSDCNVLLLSDRDFDKRFNEQVIHELGVSLAVQYLSDEDASRLLDSNLFVLYSLSEPSSVVSSNQFTRITLPSTYQLSQITAVHKYIPHILQLISSFAFDFLQALQMDNADYNAIYSSIVHEIGIDSLFLDDTSHRLQHVCKWLKSGTNIQKWTSWIPKLEDYASDSIDCGLYSDTELSTLQYLQNEAAISNHSMSISISTKQQAMELYNEQSASFGDIWTAMRVNEQCVSVAPNYPHSLLALQMVSGALIFFIVVSLILTIWSRDEVIMIAASYPLLISFHVGAMIGCLVPLFGFPSMWYYFAEIVCIHTCILLMFGSLIGKSWRLHVILVNASKGKLTKVTSKHILLPIALLIALMYLYWMATAYLFGAVYAEYHMFDSVRYLRITMKNGHIYTAVLMLLEFLFILWGARLAWSLRAVNPQFNESKHIAVILYHTFFISLLCAIFFFLLSISPHMLRALWMSVWLIMIAFAVAVLMLPKFRAIWLGVEFHDKGLLDRKQSAVLASSSMSWIPKQLTTDQIREIVSVLRKLGFKVHRERAANHVKHASSSNILKMRQTRIMHSRSTGDLDAEQEEQQPFSGKSRSTVSSNLSVYSVSSKRTQYHHPSRQLATIHSALPSTSLQIANHHSSDSSSVEMHHRDEKTQRAVQAGQVSVSKMKKKKVGSPSSHHKSATVLGLPPPSTWDYDDDEDDDDDVAGNGRNDDDEILEGDYHRENTTIVEYDIPSDLKQIREDDELPLHGTQMRHLVHTESAQQIVPPPLPPHIQQQFKMHGRGKRIGKMVNTKTKVHQRSTSAQVLSPVSVPDNEHDGIARRFMEEEKKAMQKEKKQISIAKQVETVPIAVEKKEKKTKKGKVAESVFEIKSKRKKSRGNRVSEIIARFNHINVPIYTPSTEDHFIE